MQADGFFAQTLMQWVTERRNKSIASWDQADKETIYSLRGSLVDGNMTECLSVFQKKGRCQIPYPGFWL